MRIAILILFLAPILYSASAGNSEVRLTITDGLGRELAETVDIVVRLDPSEPGHSVKRTQARFFELPYDELGTTYIVSVTAKEGLSVDRRVVITEPSTDVWIALPRPSFVGIDRHVVSGAVEGLPALVYDAWVRLVPLIQTHDLRDFKISIDQPEFAFRMLPRGRYLLVLMGKIGRPNAVPSILASREVDLTEPNSNAKLVIRLANE